MQIWRSLELIHDFSSDFLIWINIYNFWFHEMQFVLLFKLMEFSLTSGELLKAWCSSHFSVTWGETWWPLSWNRRMHGMTARTVMMPLWKTVKVWDSCKLLAGWGVSRPQFHRCWQKLLFLRKTTPSKANSMDFTFVGVLYAPQVPRGCCGRVE